MKPMLSAIAPADFLAIKYPVAVELKLDGVRTIAVVKDKKCALYSRNGKYLLNFEDVRLDMATKPEGVYDGEVICLDGFQTLLKRLQSDPGNNTDVKIEYKIFDFLTLDEWNTGISTRDYMSRCKDLGERVIIKNPVDLEVYYNYALKTGHEGLILKQLDSPYESGSSKYWLKLKPKDTIDLRIIGFDEGVGRLEGSLGAICGLGEDSKGTAIHAYVGTGFSDPERAAMWAKRDSLLGMYMEVEFQEMTKPDKFGGRSLRSPVFKCIRADKS